MIYVIAGNYQQFRWFLNHEHISPEEATYVGSYSLTVGFRCRGSLSS